MPAKQVLSVGQCWADHCAISRVFQRHFEAEVIAVDTTAEALNLLRQEAFDLVLVNRVLDRDGSRGLDLIRQLKEDEALKHLLVMLVSNQDDAQLEAARAGAEPGFGKAALGQPAMLGRVRYFME
jgi:CheY-like chemotaxis protein